jgi:hypothetical protein
MAFEYTQTRLQSRYGTRPDEHLWQHLESNNDLHNFLQAARYSVLRPWVLGLHVNDSRHDIDYTLRREFRDYITEVAGWMPAEWRAAVIWVQRLPDIPALEYLLSGGTALQWMLNDPKLKSLTNINYNLRIDAFNSSDCRPLMQSWQAGQSLLPAWISHWQHLWPAASHQQRTALRKLATIFLHHLQSLNEVENNSATAARKILADKLIWEFRRNLQQAAAAFAHLALVALDLERLRGNLVSRALFNKPARQTT